MSTTDVPATRTLVASTPGGPAPQFRVQVLPTGESVWRLFATFKRCEIADECVQQLSSEGMTVRVIAVRICPTAA